MVRETQRNLVFACLDDEMLKSSQSNQEKNYMFLKKFLLNIFLEDLQKLEFWCVKCVEMLNEYIKLCTFQSSNSFPS